MRTPHSDPFVEWFIQNGPEPAAHLEALLAVPEPRHPKIDAMIALREATMERRPFKEAFEIAERAYHVESDGDLHLLYLLMWLRVLALVVHGYQEQINVLMQRLLSLVTDSTPREIKAWILCAKAQYALLRGDVFSSERLLPDALALVEPSSIHYQGIMGFNYINLLQRGMGADTESDVQYRSHSVGAAFLKRVSIMRFINYSVTGSIPNALKYLAEIDDSANLIPSGIAPHYEAARHLLRLLLLTMSTQQPVLLPKALEITEEPLWVISARHLLKREVGKAIDSARAYVKGESQTGQFTAVGPDAYTLVRAELAAVNASAAKRLIANRRKGGTVHYLDDLFLARAALGLGNEAEAAVHFAALCHSVEKYQAQGRLDFEILLACELQPLALLKLDRQAAALREQHFERTRAGNTDLAPATTDKGLNGIISSSARMAELKKTISTYALSDLPVLIVGETGTGKDLIARALHESGPRRGKPYVTVNCGAISESLIESELFGYASGAFTGASTSHSGLFEEAGEGTIFLDEIGDISPRLQIALLRVLETGEVRAVGSTKMRYTKCRVITATNTDLVRAAEQGRFRQDLLFRLQRLEIRTPPLRERSKDIITLADYFLNLDRAQGVKATLSLELQTELCRRQWPGNVRELRNAIERMRILNSDKLHYRIEDFINIESPSATRADDTQNTSSIVGGFQSDQPADLSSKTPWGQKPAAAPQALDQASAYRSARRRREYLALLFEQHKSLHLYEVREMLGVSTATASRDLKSLVDDGIIERCAPTNSPRTFYYKFFK